MICIDVNNVSALETSVAVVGAMVGRGEKRRDNQIMYVLKKSRRTRNFYLKAIAKSNNIVVRYNYCHQPINPTYFYSVFL